MDKRLEIIGVSCDNCVGTCCRAPTVMEMTEHEAYTNKRQMKLTRILKARNYPQPIAVPAEGFDENGKRVPISTSMSVAPHHGLYIMEEDCGHLTEDNRCGIYDSPDRPRACIEYKVGSVSCLDARQAFNVESASPEI